ncbi:MAG TPA: tRNA (adenosine(37)-N6)-threonylcarbamoyltransferase complex dimerization subunit type 1 TsaB [Acidobacteriota bacterium]|nr:tRNA (adenosine(37)-N6)-threonylcarbamoyltransferase complex dimerization subunit type 1 TsaB [Acidobacteriota bacterium]
MVPINANPKILAFDTASARASVALLEGREFRAEIRLQSMKTHSIHLLGSISFLLARAGWTLKDLNLVAAGIGPGSFTGIRIGIATALGLAQSLSIPFAGISGTDVLASRAAWFDGRIGVLLDAHRDQFYYAEYCSSNGKASAKRKPALLNVSDLEQCLGDRHLYIVGDLSRQRLQEIIRFSDGWPRLIPVDLFLACGIGSLALAGKRKWRSGDNLVSEPMYIRPPDALRNRKPKR